MSIAQEHAIEATAAADRTDRKQRDGHETDSDARAGFGPVALLIGGCGGLLTGACMLAAASLVSAGPSTQVIQRVALNDVETAAQSLVAGRAVALVEDAKTCRRPLGFLVVKAAGKAVGTVRFRSGVYVSPNLRLGPQPERIALPFPASPEVGHGQIFVDNSSDGIDVFLLPGVRIGAGPSTSIINVRWDPKAPC